MTARASHAAALAVPAYDLRARRRPVAILALFLLEAAVAWILASPWVESIAGVFGHHPDGDRALWWRPGLVDLGDLYFRYRAMIDALVRSTITGLALWLIVGLFPLGALLASLSDDEPFAFPRVAARGAALFSRMALLQLASLVALGLVLALVGALPSAMIFARGGADPRRTFILGYVPWVIALVLVGYLSALFDLARALCARHDERAGRALLRALRAPRAVVALVGLSAPRWLASFGALGFGAAFSSSSTSLFAIALVHQAIAFFRVALRASVLARALRLSDSAP